MPNESDRTLYSPACAMGAADDSYMGYMPALELIDELNALLAAARAGASVAMKCRYDVSTSDARAFFRSMARDESICRATLARHISRLGGIVTPDVDAFYQPAMAVSDFAKRLEILIRGQGWVVRRLAKMIPRVRDDQIHTDLKSILAMHEQNIHRAAALIQQEVSES